MRSLASAVSASLLANRGLSWRLLGLLALGVATGCTTATNGTHSADSGMNSNKPAKDSGNEPDATGGSDGSSGEEGGTTTGAGDASSEPDATSASGTDGSEPDAKVGDTEGTTTGEPDTPEPEPIPDAGPKETRDSSVGDAAPEPSDGGQAPGHERPCADGEEYFYPGCVEEADPIVEGCYQPCAGENDTSCGAGLSCVKADINPCVCPAGSTCCDACGMEQWLCLTASPVLTCDDQSRDPIIQGASDSFGECLGECQFALTLEDAAGESCDQASLTVSDNGGNVSRTNTGLLTPKAHQAARDLAAALSDVTLEEVYGCPDCADGGASQLTLLIDGMTSTTTYEYHYPPEVLNDADAFVRQLKTALRDCQSNEWITVADDCTTQSQLPRSCGDSLTCAAGQLCVAQEVLTGPASTVNYSCESNPCSGGTLDCSCAVSLCDSNLCETSHAGVDVFCPSNMQ